MPIAVVGIIAEAIGGVALAAGASAAAATTIGAVGTSALIGAGIGAAGSAITGGDPLKGALIGGVTGGLGGAGAGAALGGVLDGVAGGALGGASTGVGNALVGAGVGALGSAATGGDPLKGAVLGGVTGYASGALGSYAGLNGGASGTNDGSLTLPNGEAIVPPVPPSLDAAGNPIGPSTGGTASGSGTSLNPLSAASSTGSSGGTASGTGGVLSKLISNPALLMGALSALQSAGNKPQQGGYATPGPSSVAATLGPKFNTPLNTNFPGRQATNPEVPSWYTYGQIPGGANFFSNNNLKAFGFAKGGALSDGEFRTSTHNRHVKGPGTEISDDVPAMLSRNEYVLDAQDVRAIGKGSNARGAKILDRQRKKLDRGGGALSRLAEAA